MKTELDWWVQNLHLAKERSIIFASPRLIIAFDASLKGWGAFCQDHRTAVSCTLLESKCFINVLELKAAKFAILTFTRMHASVQSIHLWLNNVAALSYLIKTGGTHNKVLSDISRKIWDYLPGKGITITVEYLPSALNKEANFQSRTKLDPKVFQKICRKLEVPDIDLFAFRISHQLPTYISWKLDPFSKGRGLFK